MSAEPLLITADEVKGIELAAIKAPSKDGSLAPRIIRLFIEHMQTVYGVSLEVETEEMKHERTGNIEKSRKQPGISLKLGRRKSNSDNGF